jgi:hypothetical protein
MNIAQTIRNQIRALDRNAMMAWGAKDLMNMGDGLKFKSSGCVRKKCYVYVQLDEGQDLYNIHFFQIRKHEMVTIEKIEGVFCESLVEIINRVVG